MSTSSRKPKREKKSLSTRPEAEESRREVEEAVEEEAEAAAEEEVEEVAEEEAEGEEVVAGEEEVVEEAEEEDLNLTLANYYFPVVDGIVKIFFGFKIINMAANSIVQNFKALTRNTSSNTIVVPLFTSNLKGL